MKLQNYERLTDLPLCFCMAGPLGAGLLGEALGASSPASSVSLRSTLICLGPHFAGPPQEYRKKAGIVGRFAASREGRRICVCHHSAGP